MLCKISSFVIFTLMVLVTDNEGLNPLCSTSKSDNKCICKSVTDENSVQSVADCSGINLQNFPTEGQLDTDVNLLDLSHNMIEKLEYGYSSDTLEILMISYNGISYVVDNFLYNLPNLRKLILSHNNITSFSNELFFQNSKKLKYLDLSFNYIKTIPDNFFLPLQNLHTLDLSYNDPTLGDLLTQSSDFLSAVLEISTNLTHLRLDNVGLTNLPHNYFDYYTNLKQLCLADNHFDIIPNIPYSVEYFDLSGTDLTVLQGKYLNYHSLKVLKLNRMKKLESIHHYAFYNLQALEELSINDCHQLQEFNELVFGLLSKKEVLPLKRLSLAGNSLKTLNYTYKYLFKTLEFIDLRYNPWNCDCNLLWLQEVDNLYKNESIKCATPRYLYNTEISKIEDDDIPACFPEKYGKRSHRILIPILILAVIILAALVGYLIYYAPHWYGQRTRGVGPQSPYNPTRLEEDI